ncbi:hypothetical protein B0T26DRAFT_650033 [Lasiosphaeria miniovina]|uniref:Clr5 domain-containing protein n=1 Tax=Lasiosphaeria miniovina TaxID=1954250 RepID=A0AA40ABR3_9PEZI|nr:uncharacterized protein B0T26DRAFT_650033 [Lasiosphaeria miniovina]KAK0712958.1 hypothetical protein B0T26DRAFT_650033 [Lasiosphaeria miniovina]
MAFVTARETSSFDTDGLDDHGAVFALDEDEDESSPSPEADNQLTSLSRRQPSRFSSADPSASSSPPTHSTPSDQSPTRDEGRDSLSSQVIPLVPRRAEDWEPWKSVLHELYITQNRILRDIIMFMETNYNLKATPKMYKNQFARWGFFKYAVKTRPRARAHRASLAEKAHGGRLIVRHHKAIDEVITPMLHGNDRSRVMQAGLAAVRHFLHGFIDLDAAHLKSEEVAGFDDPIYRYFKVAMDMFDLRENVEGGRVLRLAFLQIERKIAAPSMKSFADLCLLVPHLLLESGRNDILTAYLRYLTRLAKLKFGSHPLTDIAASFSDLLDQPEDIMHYILVLSQINSDTICGLQDMLERNQVWARNLYLACLQTKGAGTATRNLHKHPMIRLESQSVYWAQNLIMQDPESEALTKQWLHKNFADDFAPRCEAYLEHVKEKVAAGEIPVMFSKMMECLYIGCLNDYYETMQDWPKVFEWGRKGLTLATNEQYVLWSIHLEELMRKQGSADEAEELERLRREHIWLERVRIQVDRLSLV